MRSSLFRRGQRRVALPLFVVMTALACFGSDSTGPAWYYLPGTYQLISVNGNPLSDTISVPQSDTSLPPTQVTVYDGMVDLTFASTTFLFIVRRLSDSVLVEKTGSFVGNQVGDSLFVQTTRVLYMRGDTMVYEPAGTFYANTIGAHTWRLLKVQSY